MEGKRLHLGCGNKYLPNYYHIDLNDYDHIDLKHDISILPMIEDESIVEIYASHVLEHLWRTDIFKVISEWNRILVTGGTIRLAVPNFEAIVNKYKESGKIEEIVGLLCGGHRDINDRHGIMFDFRLLRTFLEDAGFGMIEKYDWKEFLPKGYDDYSKAYLPHMDESGKLMSLNVKAVKIGKPHHPSSVVKYAIGLKKPWQKEE